MLSLIFLAAAVTLQPNFLVTTSWLADHATETNVVVLDVTTPKQFEEGHLPGARLIDRNELTVNRAGIPDELPTLHELETLFTKAGIADAQRIVIYSREPLLASRLFFTLDSLGCGDRIAILDGGFAKWKGEGRPIETEASATKAVPFKAIVNSAALVDKAELKSLLKNGDVVLIDARPIDQFKGSVPGKGITLGGHIPSAKCLPWMANFGADDKQHQVLRSEQELRGVYSSLLPADHKRIVVYCRTGMEASMTYFVLRYLGYEPALYDGSFAEWNTTEPVARAAKVRR